MTNKISLRSIVESILNSNINRSLTIKEITALAFATDLPPIQHQLDKADGCEGVAEQAILKNITSILSKHDKNGITRLKKDNTSTYGIFTDMSVIDTEEYEVVVKTATKSNINVDNFQGYTPDAQQPVVEIDDVTLDKIIRQRFEMLEMFTEGFLAGHIKSLVISGAAGIGKTYNLQKDLEASGNTFIKITGAISGIGMYKTLYEYSDENSIIMFDDADVFKDEEAIDILKGALDSSSKREVSWLKASKYLEENGIPNQFEFKGRIVFITNKNIEKIIVEGKSSITEHIRALASRSTFLNLAIHSVKEINMLIKIVLIEQSGMREANDITLEQALEITEFFDANLDNLRMLSLREVLDCVSYMRTSPDRWKTMASVALFKGLHLAV